MQVPDNTSYPHIINDIKYGLFVDVINRYYLDSQIKDDFNCNKECYTNTQHTQQEQQLTPCTLAYDHITQHINNLVDSTQQNTLYAMEENASLFTCDTTTPCDFNITPDLKINSECKSNSKTLLGIHLQSKHKYRNILVIPINSITTLIMLMHSLLKIYTLHYYNKNCKIPTGVNMIPL